MELITVVSLSCALMTTPALAAPQMGWNTWNSFHLNYTAADLMKTADLLVSTGLRDAGYQYLIVDDGWLESTRDANGRQVPSAKIFPNGIQEVVKYTHSRDLKFGLYSDSGIHTCSLFPGSWGYEELDAQSYAAWEVDYLKFDNCGGFAGMVDPPQVRSRVMGDALRISGRDIFYSLCEWGWHFPWYWADQIGQSYRISGDITSVFSDQGADCACKTAYCLDTGYAGCSVLTIIRKMREISPFQQADSYADMDLLQIGNGNMTLEEQRTHMSFWAAMKSPLIIGSEISQLSKASLEILKHRSIIALNKDSLGLAPAFVPTQSVEHQKQVWWGSLSNNRNVLLVLNEMNVTSSIKVSLSSLVGKGSTSTKFSGNELWSGKSYRRTSSLNLQVQPHDTQVFVLQRN